MNKFKADIIIKLKNGIRDPQGHAIETVLKRIRNENANVNAGKFFELTLEAPNQNEAEEKIESIAKDILSNPVLEEYEILKVEQV